MTSREFRLFTVVWGSWHVDCFLRGTLPTLLAPNNLPALASAHRCSYRVFTTRRSAAALNREPLFTRLKSVVSLDVVIVSEGDNIHAGMTVSWWQKAVDEARDAGAVAMTVHPDFVWSDGTFSAIGRVFAEGGKAVYMPNIRVVSETFLPALAARAPAGSSIVSVSGLEAAKLALRHLHPLAAVRLPTTPHVSAATEIFWPVPSEGLLMRQLSCTAVAADPAACFVDFEFFVRDVQDLEGIVVPQQIDDMMMLSLAPLAKDLGVFEFDHDLNPLHLGRWASHPTNYTALNEPLADVALWLPLTDAASGSCPSPGAVSESSRFLRQSIGAMRATRLYHRLSDRGFKVAAGLLACALHETDVVARLETESREMMVFVPKDNDGLSCASDLVGVGREHELVQLILSHVVPGRSAIEPGEVVNTLGGGTVELSIDDAGRRRVNGREIIETFSIDRTTVYVVDKPLTHPAVAIVPPGQSDG